MLSWTWAADSPAKSASLGPVEVANRLDLTDLDRIDAQDDAEGSEQVALLNVPGHHPPSPGDPEAVESARNDLIAVKPDPERRGRWLRIYDTSECR